MWLVIFLFITFYCIYLTYDKYIKREDYERIESLATQIDQNTNEQ